MRAADVLGIVAGIAGGLPPLRLRKRRKRKPDPVAEAAAAAKRTRKAAKRAEDERRTAEGRENAKDAIQQAAWASAGAEDVRSQERMPS